MLDANLIAALETSLNQTRNAQSRMISRLRELENEAELLREEITALENTAEQTASAIDTLLVTMRSGNRNLKFDKPVKIEDDYSRRSEIRLSTANLSLLTRINPEAIGPRIRWRT